MQIYREKSIHLIIKFSPNNITLKFATRSLTKYYQETNSLPVMRSEFRCKKLVALRHGWYTLENDVIIFFSDRSVHNQTKSNTASAQEIIQTYIKLTQSQETLQTLLLISISTRTKFSNQLCIWYNVKAIFTGNVKWAIVGFFSTSRLFQSLHLKAYPQPLKYTWILLSAHFIEETRGSDFYRRSNYLASLLKSNLYLFYCLALHT